MKGNDAMSQPNKYCVKDGNIVWKGAIEEFCHLVEDATNWRLYQGRAKTALDALPRAEARRRGRRASIFT
jgi:hypothetical protein